MASSSNSRFFAGFLLVVLWSGRLYANECYSSLISFGDSVSDTGNRKYLDSISDEEFLCGSPPYGQNLIGQATGRCSNGRLIVDFLAESLGLPLILPYFNDNESGGVTALGRQGMNYAVVGATAMDSSFIETKLGGHSETNATLRVQLAWFKESLSLICGNISDCRHFIGLSLFLVGEFGANDFNQMISLGKTMDEMKLYAPLVIDAIISAVNELIEMGAQTLIVPGYFPAGCFPACLTMYASNYEEYDPITGCLTMLNEFIEYHNEMLQTKLNQIRELNPNAVIFYADYYNPVMQIHRSPNEYGFTNETLKACCGCEGPFNFNTTGKCGDACSTLCDEPNTYVSWDGIHLTEGANELVFKSMFQGPYTTPEFYPMCPTSTSQARVGLSSYI